MTNRAGTGTVGVVVAPPAGNAGLQTGTRCATAQRTMKTALIMLALGASMVAKSGYSQTWTTIDLVDEFGDKTGTTAAISQQAGADMAFPYGGITARLMVQCDDVWIRFSDTPNLTSNVSRIKVDDAQSYRMGFHHSLGSADLDFNDNLRVIADLMNGGRIRVALDWYQQARSVFGWSLTGSSHAITQSCGGYDPVEWARQETAKRAVEDDLKLLSEIAPMIEDYKGQEEWTMRKRMLRYGLERRIRALNEIPDDIRRFRDSEIGVLSDASKDRVDRIEEIQKSLTNMRASPLATSVYAKPIQELEQEARTLVNEIQTSGDIVPNYLISLLNNFPTTASSVPSPGAETPELAAGLEQVWEQETLADAEEFARDVLGTWVPDDRRIDEALRLRANSVSRLKLTNWRQEVGRIRALCEKLRAGRVLTRYRDLRGEFVPTCEEGIPVR